MKMQKNNTMALLPILSWILLATAVAAQASPGGGGEGEKTEQTQIHYLSGKQADDAVPWEFYCTHYRNSDKWTTIPVPSCWEQQGFGRYNYGHEETQAAKERPQEPSEQGLYRHRFTVPADWAGRRLFIVFDGVMTDAEVKINGVSAGPIHQGAFYRFKYDITGLAKFGSENLLEVAVSKKSADETVNQAERYGDYWVFGGIFRPVWLMAVPPQFIERVAIDARHDGAFTLDYFLGGEGKADSVEVSLLDAKGQPVGTFVGRASRSEAKGACVLPVTHKLPGSASGSAGEARPTPQVDSYALPNSKIVGRVSTPATWTAETPVLYTAVVRLKEGGVVRHEIRQRFGFRTIEVRPRDGIYVNGQRVILKGSNRHSFWPDTGRTLTEKIHRLDIALIKDMNMNAVRMSHYPPDEQFLDLCDEEGLYVLDELAGWQKKYGTGIGRKLVGEMVERDVNHPSILFWDNGNEGGWNTELDDEFAKYDPQRRTVLHPWHNFRGINAAHYAKYQDWLKMLAAGDLVMPTEFLHGLYDGGAGAGLADYWSAFRKAPNGAGGFIWVLCDEGLQRTDMNHFIDVKDVEHWAPDGIMGPYREKEGSYFTIKEIWSPVQIARDLPSDFKGSLAVRNDYSFLNLSQCRFTWQLRRVGQQPGFTVIKEGMAASPDVAPGATGTLSFDLPEDYRAADALALKVCDSSGREIWTWVWPLQPFRAAADGLVASAPAVKTEERGDELRSSAAGMEMRIVKATGQLLGMTVNGKPFSLTSLQAPQARWTMMTNGWIKLDYAVDAEAIGQGAIPGVAFDYPEEKMRGKTWLGEGPYRVWRNRQLGGTFGVWETPFNTTDTGSKGWAYPEFSGYFAGVRWMKLATTEGTLTLVVPDAGAFVRVGTPACQKACRFPDLPAGNLAVLWDVPAIGNKFAAAAQTGPQGSTPLTNGPLHGTVYLRVEAPETRADSCDVAATALVARVVPSKAGEFVCERIPTQDGKDVFEIESRGGKIVLRGNSRVAIASALKRYLADYCHADPGWHCGGQMKLPESLPTVPQKIRVVSPYRFRFDYNYCTHGYTMAWWDWPRWERELDSLAMHGVNLALIIQGQEQVWINTLRDYGYSAAEVRAWLCMPSHQPWQYMSNMEGYGGPVPEEIVRQRLALGQRIIVRMRELGLEPVQQGYYGIVPSDFRKRFPAAKIHAQGIWGFDLKRPDMLDPMDPLFAKVASSFYREQKKLFGEAKFLAADPFHEGGSTEGVDLGSAARAIYRKMATAYPEVTWVLQSWQVNPRQPMLDALDKSKCLVLDLNCERKENWRVRQEFGGTPWLWCVVQNFGGNSGLNARLDWAASGATKALRDPAQSHMAGIGGLMEGSDTMPVLWERFFDNAWSDVPVPLEPWLRDYTRRRYGAASVEAEKAWRILAATVYDAPACNEEFPINSAVCVRPSLDPGQRARLWADTKQPYDTARLAEAWRLLLDAAPECGDSDGYRYDVADVGRQVLADLGTRYHQAIVQAFQSKNPARLRQLSDKMLGLIRDMDRLAGTRKEFLLGAWIADARSWGVTPEEKDLCEWNARLLLTVWSLPTSNIYDVNKHVDYANRHWNGLLGQYYFARWKLWLDALNEAVGKGGKFDPAPVQKRIQDAEFAWTRAADPVPAETSGDTIVISKKLLAKYAADGVERSLDMQQSR